MTVVPAPPDGQTASAEAALAEGGGAGSSFRSAWYAVAILSLAYVMSYADRVIINLLSRPIKADLGLSDTQFGLLTGVAFGVLYTGMALPFGRMADIYSRRWIMFAGVAVFSTFSMGSGLAVGFLWLFVARVGVGAGEASLTPAAHSIIRDYFPSDKMGLAMSVFVTSAFIGSGLAYVGGGALVGALNELGATPVPLLGDLRPWQLALILVALPGFITAPLLLTIREPVRKGAADGVQSIKVVARAVYERRAALVPLLLGFAFVALSGHASSVWTAPVFDRVFGWGPKQFGLYYGLTYLAFAPVGALFAGWFCDQLTKRGVRDAPLRVAAFAALIGGVSGGLAPLMPTPQLALAFFGPALLAHTLCYPLAATAIQLIAPSGMRAQLSAVYLMVIGVVAQGVGPVSVGLMTDYVFTAPEHVRYSLALVTVVCGPLTLLCLLAASKPYAALRRLSPA